MKGFLLKVAGPGRDNAALLLILTQGYHTLEPSPSIAWHSFHPDTKGKKSKNGKLIVSR